MPEGSVARQIILRDDAAATLHLGGDCIGHGPRVETRSAVGGDRTQRVRERGLLEHRANRERMSVRHEQRGTGKRCDALRVATYRFLEGAVDGESAVGQSNCWRFFFLLWFGAVARVCLGV